MKKILLLLLLNTFIFADMLGGEVSVGIYNHSLEGTSSYGSSNPIDFSEDLHFSTTQNLFFKAYLEHPLPLMPNIRLAYHTHSYDSAPLLSSFFWGEIENFTGTVNSDFSLDYRDITLYYELFDHWINLDGGLTFRSLQGEMTLENRLLSSNLSYNEPIAMLYAKARFYIPSTDISLQGELNLMPLGEIKNYDLEISARYTFELGLGIEIGYKYFYLESDTLVKGLSSELSIDGLYLSTVWDF